MILDSVSGIGSTPPIPRESISVDSSSCPKITPANPAATPARWRENEIPVMIRIPSKPDKAVNPIRGSGTRQASGPSLNTQISIKPPAINPPKALVKIPVFTSPNRAPTRLVIVDWRKNPEYAEGGPPLDIRFSKEEVAGSLAPYFRPASVEDLGPVMLAVVAVRAETGAE